MSDTPETDDQPIIYAMNHNDYQVLCVDLEFARNLERERNEAQDMVENFAEQGLDLMDANRTLKRERDEARQECDNLKQELEIVTARLHGKKHPLDNGIPERHEVYIWKNGKYELDP